MAAKPRIQIDGKWYRLKKNGKPGVELTHNGGTKTQAEFFSTILSALRRLTHYWKPRQDKLNEGRRASRSNNKRLKYEYSCEQCNKWFPAKQIEIDHIVPCGGINDFSKIEGWCRRAFIEKHGFQRLCLICHLQKGIEVDKPLKGLKANYPREESTYRNMMSRCNNPKATGYHNYGGRGISVCESWQESFFNFYADMGERPLYTSLDRVDCNGNYCKENCRWATSTEQGRNTSSNNILIYNGESKCIQEWAEELGIKPNTLVYRILRGWPVGEALEKEPRSKSIYNGRLSAKEIKEIVDHINQGMSQTECGKLYEIDGSQINRIYHKFKDHLYIFDLDD